MANVLELLGTHVHNSAGEIIDLKSKCKNKTLCIYFSASWCGPCQAYTPELIKFYNKNHEKKNFEIIFASSDQSEESFKKYYGKMPWLAISFDDQELINDLKDKFKVDGIPTLVVLDGNSGDILNSDAYLEVQNDPEADNFPWKK